ncbi:hypothetical protein HW555_000309 [Spodoptera exigua]|uniref:Serum response factor-binding protein 1 n=1 Tax=Spodoptera exigua TaxID=7107 RepID=A0A835LBF6_SPOEX|nr:hypothetical protein HW555_000309 [Spodoptera exigua]
MEVGAVKQAFNNEVILLKKKLNQAKIQIIHKLTRKAKQLTEKKAPEQLKEKLKRKAESAVKEVLIIKKIKAKDLAKFIVTHKGELNTFLNKPQVDEEKACARLLLHKALQDKYKFIRSRFSNEKEVINKVSNPGRPSPKIEKQEAVVNKKSTDPVQIKPKIPERKEPVKKDPIKKQKELNKTKNFNEKLLQKKLKKGVDAPVVENKIVDPFFITATGENYMSVVEPRAPDEVKEEHMRGNRKMRRAAMFGHVPTSRPRQNNYNNDRFNNQNGYDKGNNYKRKFDDKPQFNDKRNFNDKKNFRDGKNFNDRQNFNDRKNFGNRNSYNNDFNSKPGFNTNDRNKDGKQEKLHPSWEAKKKKSGILPFEGKKIVFDES